MNRKRYSAFRRQRGLTLVEIMVALTIGLVLVAGTIQLFIGSKQTYRFQEALSRLQENGRFAVEFLNGDIRWAGNIGCEADLRPETPPGTGMLAPGHFRVALNDPTNFAWDLDAPVQGHYWDATGSAWLPAAPALPVAVSSSAMTNSDVVTLRGATSSGVTVTMQPGTTPPGSAALIVTSGSGIQQGDILLVGDCAYAAVFQVTTPLGAADTVTHGVGGSVSPGNRTTVLGREFVGGDVMRLTTRTYFVGTGIGGGPALFRRVNLGASQELVEGVARMVIRYGVDTSGDRVVDVYQTAAQVDAGNDWDKVISLRISLLLQSNDGVTDAPQSINFDGAMVNTGAGADRRLRQVYTTTVALRNLLP